MESAKLLGIYLNDHLAADFSAVELARRTLDNNTGSSLGEFLEELVPELEADHRMLEEVLERAGIAKSVPKQAVGWLGEKIGRLKTNGQVTGYSPLSRVLEIEGLMLAVTAKLCALLSLQSIGDENLISELQLQRMIKAGGNQMTRLERFRRQALRTAFEQEAVAAS